MKCILAAVFVLIAATSSFAASFHWVDRQGFHSVDQVTKVPLEHRKDLPMARNGAAFPFTEEEDRDGSMFVWFTLGEAGLGYPFVSSRNLPKADFFIKVSTPRPGDVAWWDKYVALCQGNEELISARGKVSLQSVEKKRGKVTWYRYAGLPATKPAAAAASPKILKQADEILARFSGAAIVASPGKDAAGSEAFRKEWEKGAAVLEELRKRFPDDPQLLRRVGICFRYGYNLGISGGWERAEAYLLRAEYLAPDAPEPHISLGILYADSSTEYAKNAENHFRKALPLARKADLPQIWWGLALALHYQGKTAEAVDAIDRVIALHPEDANAQKMRKTILEAGKE